MRKKDSFIQGERRQYIRLDSVFPVEFQLLSLDEKSFLSGRLQGFTNNVGKGGLCLRINNLDPESAKLIKGKQARISLKIEMPVHALPVDAVSSVAWVQEITPGTEKLLIGLHYEKIDSAACARIMRYAWTKKLFIPSVITTVAILGLLLTANTIINIKLVKGNKALVEQLVKIIQESSIAKQKVKQINKEREDLQLRIQALELRIRGAQEEKAKLSEKEKLAEAGTAQKTRELRGLIEKLSQEKGSLQEQLINVQSKESSVTDELLRLDKRKTTLEKANFDKMYQWLKVHQNLRTGLISSFEGASDIASWAFTYDQALAAQAYTNFGDLERARKILDFFSRQAERVSGLFVNAYYAQEGKPAEYVVHSGPNIWLGIAALQYGKKTQDLKYLNLAEEAARGIISLQSQDKEGGIRGGPNVGWYATEHNLDAYAFFNMLHNMTHKAQYQEAANKALNWLVTHTYDKLDAPIKRGKGDSTIATDTYAWSIAAIGAQKLEELGMNPERIVEFAEENCLVQVDYTRPEGQVVKIKGFDFAPQRNVARGGVVSSEWTAQMAIAFNLIADFYYKKEMPAKGRAYELKADEYLAELGNMIVSSPSPSGQGEGCLPYATQDFVDTGHGWMTPKGKFTGSVAGTAYALFAYYNYNPLELGGE